MRQPKTFITTPKIIKRQWHLIDLKGQILGRITTQICDLLTGKNKPYYTPAMDCGDYVVAINAKKIKTSGEKGLKKLYRWHTNWPGGFRERTLTQMMAKDPRKVIELAVTGMLPKNKLRFPRLRRLKIFSDDKHIYEDKFKTQNAKL